MEQRDQLISQLQIQLESLGVQPVSPVPPEEPHSHSEREEQTSSVETSDGDDEDDDSRALRYFAVSFLRRFLIYVLLAEL